MKKHELIKHAYDNYPKGTKFKCLETKEQITSNGNFILNGWNRVLHINENNNGKGVVSNIVQCELKWAEIVKPKTAVKVENEKEFNALMKYYDSLGYKHTDHHTLRGFGLTHRIIAFCDEFMQIDESNIIATNQYQIIPFQQFAKEHNIKLPLLTSEDGVYLYEGDKAISVLKELKYIYDEIVLPFDLKDNQVYFSTKQAALDWIEAQKPKETVLEYGAYKFTIKSDSVNVSHGDSDTDIDIKAIYIAWLDNLLF